MSASDPMDTVTIYKSWGSSLYADSLALTWRSSRAVSSTGLRGPLS